MQTAETVRGARLAKPTKQRAAAAKREQLEDAFAAYRRWLNAPGNASRLFYSALEGTDAWREAANRSEAPRHAIASDDFFEHLVPADLVRRDASTVGPIWLVTDLEGFERWIARNAELLMDCERTRAEVRKRKADARRVAAS